MHTDQFCYWKNKRKRERRKKKEKRNFQSCVHIKKETDTYFSIREINIALVRKCLSNLDTTKDTVLDCIGPKLLKTGSNVLLSSITIIINKSLNSGIFPSLWKHVRVNPFFKTGLRDELNNSRPISILPTISKMIEKWISIKFTNFFVLLVLWDQCEYSEKSEINDWFRLIL